MIVKHLFSFCALLISVYAGGEFSVLTQPPSCIFKGHDHIKESLLKEVFSASLGFTTEQESNFQGMYLSDPFNLGKAVVTVAVDGVSDIGQSKGQHYPLRTDEDENETFEAMTRRVQDRYPFGNNDLIRVELNQGLFALEGIDMFQGIKVNKPEKTVGGALKLAIDEDRQFLEEIALLNAIVDKVEKASVSSDHCPAIYWFKVNALHAVSDLHGENSTATKEAKQLLIDAIDRLNDAFKKLFKGRVLISVITSDASHTRRVRRDTAPGEEATVDEKNWNLAKNYSGNYPVIFNIILWFGVVMVFALLAITMFIGNMDPGRDSIIYRMTSTRMKKDN